MGKAVNSLINRSTENDTKVVKLTIIDFFQKDGERVKTVVKEKFRQPHERVVTKVREVVYIYDKKTTKGWEIVEEQLVARGTGSSIVPEVVGEVIKDLRDPNYKEPRRYNNEDRD